MVLLVIATHRVLRCVWNASGEEILATESPIKIDAGAVVRFFGGPTELRFRLERRGLGILSKSALDKWVQRQRIPGEWLLALMALARIERMRFVPLAFVDR